MIEEANEQVLVQHDRDIMYFAKYVISTELLDMKYLPMVDSGKQYVLSATQDDAQSTEKATVLAGRTSWPGHGA